MAATDQSKRYDDAVDALRSGRVLQAEALLHANLLEGPRAAQSRYLLGIAELIRGRIDIARQLIDSAYKIKPWLRDLSPSVVDLGPHARSAHESMPEWTWPRYELERHAFFSVGLRLDHVITRHLARSDVYFVEVGANDGRSHDPIFSFVTKYGWSGLCVEPVPSTFAQLEATYADHPTVTTVQTAIAALEGTVDIHIGDRSTLATLKPERNVLSRQSGTTTIPVAAMPLEVLLKRHGVEHLDLLQIDTEGYDYEVLKTIELSGWQPMLINMEFYCLPLTERLATFSLLRSAGYAYRFGGMDLIAIDQRNASPDFAIADLTDGRWLTGA